MHATDGLVADIVHCPACGAPKLAHNLCSGCFSEISRRWKREAKDESSASS
jgi:large subunit ribosomal protein L32